MSTCEDSTPYKSFMFVTDIASPLYYHNMYNDLFIIAQLYGNELFNSNKLNV